MEFFSNNLDLIIWSIFLLIWGYIAGNWFPTKKLQPNGDALSVSTNELTKEVSVRKPCNCTKCTGFKSPDEYYLDDETDR